MKKPNNLIIPFASASSVEKHLDQMQDVFYTLALTSIVIILADAGAESDVSFLGFKVDTSSAYGIAASALAVMFLIGAQALARVGDTVAQAESEETPKVLASVFAHRSPLNPFSYFGPRRASVIHTSFGMPVMVFQWWLGLTALALLWNRMSPAPGGWDFCIRAAYVFSGAVTLVALWRVQRVILERLSVLAETTDQSELVLTHRAVRSGFRLRNAMSLASSAVGYALFHAFTHIGM